jgi:hypothetical protein
MTRGCATLRIDVHNTLVSVPGRGPALAYPPTASNLALSSRLRHVDCVRHISQLHVSPDASYVLSHQAS